MGRIYVGGSDSGFGCTVDDVVAYGLKYLEGSISLPPIPPSVSSHSMDETAMDEMMDDGSGRNNQNRRRSFGYDCRAAAAEVVEEEDDEGDDYEGDYYFNGVNDRDMEI
ncbi:hypothetical protein TrRE_jg8226 [Triparma retinervis]|uniref:Uncharacterized protein n=1 Tax=Triparma retinervis TaxID=2557542 RepID=A0A9W6ZD64_9STRA|nr:hypothetical protein TrRE_jg8226 [Triparma retinervis]